MAHDPCPESRAPIDADDDPLVTFAEAGALTGYAAGTLRNMRYRDPDPPPFVEVRPRAWRARRSEVLRWAALRAQTVNRRCGEAS